MTDEEWKKFQDWHASGASPKSAPVTGESSGGEGWMGSIGAGFKGAAREFSGDKTTDPSHSTAEWVGRQAADWGPLVAVDALMPEVALPAAALRYAPRVASLATKGLTGAYKGAIGGAMMQPQDRPRGATTGAEAGAAGGAARAGFGMLPGWAKAGTLAALPNLAGLANIAHEATGSKGGYISPWSLHHAISALSALAAAAAGMPATSGGAASAIQNQISPETVDKSNR